MNMQAYSTAHNVSAPTLDRKEPVMSLTAHMDVLETALSTCAEGLGILTSSILRHTLMRQTLMTLDVEAQHMMSTTKGGLMTWVTATYQHHLLRRFLQRREIEEE